MPFFFWGSVILLAATAVFYLVFFSLLWYWHERMESFIIPPLIYTFEFFLVGFLILCIATIFLQFFPDITTLLLQIWNFIINAPNQ